MVEIGAVIDALSTTNELAADQWWWSEMSLSDKVAVDIHDVERSFTQQ